VAPHEPGQATAKDEQRYIAGNKYCKPTLIFKNRPNIRTGLGQTKQQTWQN
jgi:hypothetical protein